MRVAIIDHGPDMALLRMHHMASLGQLGLVPAGSRQVKPMPKEILDMVPMPVDNILTLKKSDPDVERDTMPLLISKVKRTLSHTSKLAGKLKGASLHETVLADSKFLLTYIRYVKDDEANEQIRSPRRTIHEGKGDCDCMASLVASLLANQKVKFYFRIAKYKTASEWSHIYIVVPKNQSSSKKLTNRDDYYVIDPVTNKTDYEASFTAFKDYTMGLQYLDGLGSGTGHMGCADGKCNCDKTPVIKKLRHFVPSEQIVAEGKVPTEVFLRDKKIPYQSIVENNQGWFIVNTVAGAAKIAPVITKDQAASLEALAVKGPQPPTRDEKYLMLKATESTVRGTTVDSGQTTAIQPATNSQTLTPAIDKAVDAVSTVATKVADHAKTNWLWWVLGAGAVYLATSAKPKASVAVNGLGALPAPVAKVVKKAKKKIPTFKM